MPFQSGQPDDQPTQRVPGQPGSCLPMRHHDAQPAYQTPVRQTPGPSNNGGDDPPYYRTDVIHSTVQACVYGGVGLSELLLANEKSKSTKEVATQHCGARMCAAQRETLQRGDAVPDVDAKTRLLQSAPASTMRTESPAIPLQKSTQSVPAGPPKIPSQEPSYDMLTPSNVTPTASTQKSSSRVRFDEEEEEKEKKAPERIIAQKAPERGTPQKVPEQETPQKVPEQTMPQKAPHDGLQGPSDAGIVAKRQKKKNILTRMRQAL